MTETINLNEEDFNAVQAYLEERDHRIFNPAYDIMKSIKVINICNSTQMIATRRDDSFNFSLLQLEELIKQHLPKLKNVDLDLEFIKTVFTGAIINLITLGADRIKPMQQDSTIMESILTQCIVQFIDISPAYQKFKEENLDD